MDRTSVTEMDKGGVYEMDRQTKCQKMEMPLKWITFNKIFLTDNRMCYYILSVSVAFLFLGKFSVHPFYRHLLFPYL